MQKAGRESRELARMETHERAGQPACGRSWFILFSPLKFARFVGDCISRPVLSLPQHPGEDQWSHDGCVALDDVLRGLRAELAPGDFLVRHRAGVAAVTRGGVADLAEITP